MGVRGRRGLMGVVCGGGGEGATRISECGTRYGQDFGMRYGCGDF